MTWLFPSRLGIILMVFGEIGNFSAYGFAPASLVAPLGTTTVIGMNIFAFLHSAGAIIPRKVEHLIVLMYKIPFQPNLVRQVCLTV